MSDGYKSNDYTLEVLSVVRREGYLVGTLLVTCVSGSGGIRAHFLSDTDFRSGQNEYRYMEEGMQSPRNVTLMGPQGRVFPARYYGVESGDLIYLLADMSLNGNQPKAGDSSTYTVVWPDTGEDSVTIDSPHRFRITDIPVEDG